MTFAIRAYATADLPALQAIRQAAFAPVFQSFRAITGPDIAAIAFATADEEQARLLADICAANPQQVLVAGTDDVIAGFVSYTLDHAAGIGEIGLNAVHPDCAGRGIGTALYDHVLAIMRAAGMKLATVGTGGDPSHAPARRAYEKAGFGPAVPSVYLYRLL